MGAAKLVRGARSETADACAVAIMAKASVPGLCKTRLIERLGADEAAALNTAFLQDMANNVALAGRGAAIDLFMAFGPIGAAPFFERHMSPSTGLIEIVAPDFGLCLSATIRRLLDLGYQSAVVLNSDSPTLPTSILSKAARLLAEPGDRAVLGPSADGGYYLLGLKAPHDRLFRQIDWSTPAVAAQTRVRAQEIGLAVAELPEWYDVDDRTTLARLQAELARPSSPFAYSAPHTATLLARLCSEGAAPLPAIAE